MGGSSGSEHDDVYVELYVRSLSPRESRRRIEAIVGTLDALATSDVLSGYRVLPTGTELPATPADAITEYGSYLVNRVVAFQEWATSSGRSLGSLFERRTVFSRFTHEEHDVLVFPTVVMAEYVGGDLRFVTPCHENDEHVTVRNRLETLGTGEDEDHDGDRLDLEDRIHRSGGTPPTESRAPGR